MTYDNPDNYSISVLWYTDQRVEAIKALRKAGEAHNLSLMACKQTLEEVLNGTFGSTKTDPNEPWNGLYRNTTLILRANNIQRELDAEKEREARDYLLLTRLKDALAAVPASGYEYDEFGHYVGKTATDEDYATLGRTVLTIYSHYVK